MTNNVPVAKTLEMSLADATKPVLVVSRLVGMNPKADWHEIYTFFLLAYAFLAIYCKWKHGIGQDSEHRDFKIFVYGFQDSCYMTSVVVILGACLVNKERFTVCRFTINDFANVDQCLKSLGRNVCNRVIYRFQMIRLILTVLVPSCILIVAYAVRLSLSTNFHLTDLMTAYYGLIMLNVNAAADCCFSTFLSIIRARFKEINFIIRGVGKYELDSRVNVIEVSRAHSDNEFSMDLKILRKQYHNLWRIANGVNDAHGLHVLVAITTSFALITSKLWESYRAYIHLDESIVWLYAGSISWSLFYFLRILHLVQASQSTVAEVRAMTVVLWDLELYKSHDHATQIEIRDFLTQLQLEVLNFTACGFFDIDFKLIAGILGAVCTYLVIMIQMGDSNDCNCEPRQRDHPTL